MKSRLAVRNNLLITTAVIVTVFLALFMSQQDGQGGESRLSVLVETGVAVGETRLAVLLPTTTSAAPGTATVTVSATALATDLEETAVNLLATCQHIPVNWSPHVVREGETVYTLSIISGATVNAIVQANCLIMTQGIDGLIIYLPSQPPTRVTCGPPNWWQPQLIYGGDTLYNLSLRYGTSVYAIMQANCLSSSHLVAGRTLYLPPVVATATSTPLLPTPTLRATPTAVATMTIIPTLTVTAVPTVTIAPTMTAVPTITPTVVITSTPIPITPTMTFTPSPTPPTVMTETAVPTVTPTSTPTPTPTFTPTPTPLPTAAVETP